MANSSGNGYAGTNDERIGKNDKQNSTGHNMVTSKNESGLFIGNREGGVRNELNLNDNNPDPNPHHTPKECQPLKVMDPAIATGVAVACSC